ncbi:hypothetical protein C7447_102253 [Tenacibaculum adriaticum]|uniref:Uncharacterized protein n=1 Tax=Tenacibaculum adriaticum TaxID=413713 RepID=A0A5S5DT31_9FLAO|nr:hypothetical protein [Tenacibaculum adriaticum]TYP98935.1 hypothetical protein C7447_102253 [Tenacibaculum adriaticum]
MSKKVLFIGAEMPIKFEHLDSAQHLLFKNVLPTATVETLVERATVDNQKITTPVSLGMLVEAQQKIQRLLSGTAPTYELVDNGSGSPMLTRGIVQVALGGEILLGDDDTLNVDISEFGDNAQASVFALGGKQKATSLYQLKRFPYSGKDYEQRLDVSEFNYLVFKKEAASIPEELTIFYDAEKETIDAEILEAFETTTHGVVGHLLGVPVYGSRYCHVLDVRKAKEIIIEDTRGEDYEFFGVKFN